MKTKKATTNRHDIRHTSDTHSKAFWRAGSHVRLHKNGRTTDRRKSLPPHIYIMYINAPHTDKQTTTIAVAVALATTCTQTVARRAVNRSRPVAIHSPAGVVVVVVVVVLVVVVIELALGDGLGTWTQHESHMKWLARKPANHLWLEIKSSSSISRSISRSTYKKFLAACPLSYQHL